MKSFFVFLFLEARYEDLKTKKLLIKIIFGQSFLLIDFKFIFSSLSC